MNELHFIHPFRKRRRKNTEREREREGENDELVWRAASMQLWKIAEHHIHDIPQTATKGDDGETSPPPPPPPPPPPSSQGLHLYLYFTRTDAADSHRSNS